jgi:hypothetical protein
MNVCAMARNGLVCSKKQSERLGTLGIGLDFMHIGMTGEANVGY